MDYRTFRVRKIDAEHTVVIRNFFVHDEDPWDPSIQRFMHSEQGRWLSQHQQGRTILHHGPMSEDRRHRCVSAIFTLTDEDALIWRLRWSPA